MLSSRSFVIALGTLLSTTTLAQEQKYGLGVEYFRYEDRIYSYSRKTEIGEQVELDAAFKYLFNDDTFARIRMDIDPQRDSFEGKASKLELLLSHTADAFSGQLDLDLKGQDGDTGGLSVGPDVDSFRTSITYRPHEDFEFSFYPYNFGGEVGDEFNTWDVTRIYYITNSPNTLFSTPNDDESLEARTIPGFGFNYANKRGLFMSAGLGVATYLYPADSSFDISNNRAANRWERREDMGYRLAFGFENEFFSSSLEHVAHDSSHETGSLLSQATALQLRAQIANGFFEIEAVRSVAGSRAYAINESGSWFKTIDPNNPTEPEPVYSDYYGNPQNWLGKEDYAGMIKVGLVGDGFLPYVAVKYQGENFVFRELESAHLLRTNDDSRSHGGLMRYALGAQIFSGELEIQPEIEYLQAKNEVFGNSADIREDRFLSELKNSDLLVTLRVGYQFDEEKVFKPYRSLWR